MRAAYGKCRHDPKRTDRRRQTPRPAHSRSPQSARHGHQRPRQEARHLPARRVAMGDRPDGARPAKAHAACRNLERAGDIADRRRGRAGPKRRPTARNAARRASHRRSRPRRGRRRLGRRLPLQRPSRRLCPPPAGRGQSAQCLCVVGAGRFRCRRGTRTAT